MVRATYALRPEGIEWPLREDGLPSFRLEDLTTANGISHEAAHDALSDVHATIALARLIREKQPRLYDYVLNNRDKRSVQSLLDVARMKPVLHVSGMFGAQRNNIALIVPLAVHPVNRNEMLCYDLSIDPQPLLELDVEALQKLLYTRTEDIPQGMQRPGLKSVHINRCPILVTAKMADSATAARLGISGEQCRKHLATLREFRARNEKAFIARIQSIYSLKTSVCRKCCSATVLATTLRPCLPRSNPGGKNTVLRVSPSPTGVPASAWKNIRNRSRSC
jgi:exodeoxyribonuclease-1